MLLHLWLLHLWATKLLQLWLIPKTRNPNSKLPFHDLTVKLAQVRYSFYKKNKQKSKKKVVTLVGDGVLHLWAFVTLVGVVTFVGATCVARL